jgi:phenylacetate-coenzyme A ligase PaaK-like adenylate-forming protein
MPTLGYPTLFRRALFPALDRLNGTRVSHTLAFLEASQWLPAERLHELQERKLRAALDWAERCSAFYRRLWREAGPERRAASAYPALDGLPVVTKQELRGAAAEFPLPAYRGRVVRVETSGSTGRPMTFLRSAEQESWFWALRLRMWQWGGYVPGEPYLTLNLNPRTAWRKRLQDVLFRCSYHGFNANRHDVDAVLHDLARRRVRCLVGYASSLYLLSEAVRRRGLAAQAIPRLAGILSTGDTLFPSYRRAIEETFGAGVVDYYGAGGEGLHLASQCEERGLYHLHVESSVIEVLKDGRPARPGEIGEVVVTQLDNRAMPLVRYATEDAAVPAAADARCPCGRALPLLAAVEGRVPDIVVAPDGSALVVHFFTILFEHLPGVRQFQVRQREPGRITVRLVLDGAPGTPGTPAIVEPAVREAVARATAGSLAVDFEYVDDIPLAPSQKRRLVISELCSGPLALGAPPPAR